MPINTTKVTGMILDNRKVFARTGHGFYVLNPGLEVRIGKEWTPIYDRLCPPELDRHLRDRARLEENIVDCYDAAQPVHFKCTGRRGKGWTT